MFGLVFLVGLVLGWMRGRDRSLVATWPPSCARRRCVSPSSSRPSRAISTAPPLLTGATPGGLGSYTTFFTHGLDIAVIAPSAVLAGVLLLRRQALGAILGSVLLLLCTLIGPMVILQTVMQLRVGVVLRVEQVVVIIGGFLVMSLLAAGVTVAVFRQIGDAERPEALR